MAVLPLALKPIVDALDDLEAAAARVVLAASEQAAALPGDIQTAVARLAATLWDVQESRERARAIAAETGTPPAVRRRRLRCCRAGAPSRAMGFSVRGQGVPHPGGSASRSRPWALDILVAAAHTH